jgi:hypothetical protein
MLSYNGPNAGFGPYMLAMQGGAPFAFGDAIVEYNLQSNDGFGELGLEYRGQSPETANSYVFYPSIWNGQNTWLLHSLIANGDTAIGTGGAFGFGVWYAVKAAIGGSSYAFVINGTQVLAATDTSYSSGSVGLLAWGNTVSSVMNFHIRPYVATDPTATVGSQQTGP